MYQILIASIHHSSDNLLTNEKQLFFTALKKWLKKCWGTNILNTAQASLHFIKMKRLEKERMCCEGDLDHHIGSFTIKLYDYWNFKSQLTSYNILRKILIVSNIIWQLLDLPLIVLWDLRCLFTHAKLIVKKQRCVFNQSYYRYREQIFNASYILERQRQFFLHRQQ